MPCSKCLNLPMLELCRLCFDLILCYKVSHFQPIRLLQHNSSTFKRSSSTHWTVHGGPSLSTHNWKCFHHHHRHQIKSYLLNNKAPERLLHVAKTYNNDKSNGHYIDTLFTTNINTTWTLDIIICKVKAILEIQKTTYISSHVGQIKCPQVP